MSSTQTSNEHATQVPGAATVDLKLEVVAIPVSDVDRAKRFYGAWGGRLDADFMIGKDLRAVQLTPPGSPCSIHFAHTTAAPGSAQGMFLVVSDIEAAREELVARGVGVSEVFHLRRRPSGPLCQASARNVSSYAPTPHSAIQTAMAGFFKRSRRGFPDEDSAWTSRR